MTVTHGISRATGGSPNRLPYSTSHTTRGRNMNTTRQAPTVRDTLDVLQALLLAAQHPGIRDVEPYGPGVGGIEGVKVRFVWEPNNHLWAYLAGNDIDGNGRQVDRKPSPKPFAESVPWAPVPDPKSDTGSRDKWLAADYVLKLVHDLCETARPDMFQSWTPVALHGVGLGHGPSGLAIAAGNTRTVIRVTIGSGPNRDPEQDPWPGYRMPA